MVDFRNAVVLKPRLVLLGKLPPPYMGPAVATEIILKSSLNRFYDIVHVDTKVNEDLGDLGKWKVSKLFRNLSVYRNLAATCLRTRPDIVVVPISQTTTGFLKDSILILIASLFSQSVVLQLRGSNFRNWYGQVGKGMKAYVSHVLGKSDGVIVLGNNLRYLFEDFFRKDQIFVVPNGGNYELPVAARGQDALRLLFIGHLKRSKGIQDVIQAVGILAGQTDIPFRLDVIGGWLDDDVRATCEKLVSDRNLPVTFHSPELSHRRFEFLARADIFVFPPRSPEGHPWVIVEALAAGLPIISTDQGAIRESVIHGENGFIVDTESPGEIADRLLQFMADVDLRIAMGKKSREFYLDKFTEEAMVHNLDAAFRGILKVA